VGTTEKAGAGRAESGKNKIGEGSGEGEGALSYFFFQIPQVLRPLFRSSPLTESLELTRTVATLHLRTAEIGFLTINKKSEQQ